jgi:hypothetical protein
VGWTPQLSGDTSAIVSPQLVRQWFRTPGRAHPLTAAVDAASRTAALRVLAYCLDDIIDCDAGTPVFLNIRSRSKSSTVYELLTAVVLSSQTRHCS